MNPSSLAIKTGLCDRVVFVVPAFNEQENLPSLLAQLAHHRPLATIVVDNNSTDGTARVATSAGATVVTEPQRGYGAACWAGYRALPPSCDVVCFIDADLADDPSYVPKLVAPIVEGNVDMTLGARIPKLRDSNAMTIQQTFGNWLATHLIGLGWNYRYSDLGPFRAIRKSALDQLTMRDRRYGWTIEMQIRAIEERLIVREVPVPYRARRAGQSKISGSLRGTLLAGYWILRTVGVLAWRRRRRPQSIEHNHPGNTSPRGDDRIR